MLIDPDFQKSLENLPAEGDKRRRRPRNRDDGAPRLGASAPWRIARKGEGRTRTRLERLFCATIRPVRSGADDLTRRVFGDDLHGFAPPHAVGESSTTPENWRRSLSYASLCHYGVRADAGVLSGKGPPCADSSRQGRDAATSHGYLESVEPGGNTNFSATLRNALARGDDRSVYVILSDFADANWERGIRALMHGTSRIVSASDLRRRRPGPRTASPRTNPKSVESIRRRFWRSFGRRRACSHGAPERSGALPSCQSERPSKSRSSARSAASAGSR